MSEEAFVGFPDELRGPYQLVRDQLVNITFEWDSYCNLFGVSEKRLQLLNTAPAFFTLVHKALLDAVVLGLTRLQDPAKSFKSRNLSFATLVELSREAGQCSLADRLDSLLTKIRDSFETISRYRSKKIAHTDFDLRHDALSPGSRKQISDCIKLHQEFMEMLLTEFEDCGQCWEVIAVGDSDAVLSILKDYHAFHKLERQDWEFAARLRDHEFKDA